MPLNLFSECPLFPGCKCFFDSDCVYGTIQKLLPKSGKETSSGKDHPEEKFYGLPIWWV